MSESRDLYRLQEIDTTWDKVRRRLLQLQNLSSGSEQLKTARAEVESTEAELQKWQSEQKDAELESRSLEKRIQESERRLMSGEVRNPKELEALQASVEALRRQKSSVEDKGVEALMKVEELSAAVAEQKGVLSSLEAEWQEQQTALEEELLQRKKEYIYLKKLREQTLEQVSDDLIAQYDRLRQRKSGVAVARVEDGVCGACHVQLPTSVASEVRRGGTLTYCPGCGRILHA